MLVQENVSIMQVERAVNVIIVGRVQDRIKYMKIGEAGLIGSNHACEYSTLSFSKTWLFNLMSLSWLTLSILLLYTSLYLLYFLIFN